MDIIDSLIAQALSPQGQIAGAAARAQAAVNSANQAVTTVNSLLDDIDLLTEQTESNNQTAAEAAQQVSDALNSLDTTILEMDDRITALENTNTDFVQSISFTDSNTSSNKKRQAIVSKNGTNTTYDVVKNYTATGQNEDGSMTQKAITQALNTLESKINTPSGGSGNVSGNFTDDQVGHIVIVDDDKNIAASAITENELIYSQIINGAYTPFNAKGIEIDYANRSVNTIYTSNEPIAAYTGRKRCNVADNGTINAFYGDANYKDDGSNGQVMVYQPKFYYMRFPLQRNGATVLKEIIAVTSTKQAGFKLHPAFRDANGNEIEYILLSAYEGSAYLNASATYDSSDSSTINFNTDKLSSVAGAKPITGANKTWTLVDAEKLATNRGANWHISTLLTESINQLLFITEFGTLNAQEAIELGISSIEDVNNYNCSSYTGSTSSLGNTTGYAASTTNERNGTTYNYTNAGRRAISYRGVENLWGNTFNLLGDALVVGDGTNVGTLYICSNYNYSMTLTNNYQAVNITLPSLAGWISNLGYDSNFDWLLIPTAVGNNATSSRPVGDETFTTANLNGVNVVLNSGRWDFAQNSGLFFYAFDRFSTKLNRGDNVRLIYHPVAGTIHDTNVNKWKNAN